MVRHTLYLVGGKGAKPADALPNDIILPDLKGERKSNEVGRSWINQRFQLLDAHGNAIPALRIPYKCVEVPISQSILAETGIKCAQVRGMQSTAAYEQAFKQAGEWDPQFPGVVTVKVTAPVIEIYKRFFTGKNVDDPKASAKFRQALGVAVAADPSKFEYNCTDGAHRTELGTENFGPDVHAHSDTHPVLHSTHAILGTRVLPMPFSGAAHGVANCHRPRLKQNFAVCTL